MGFTYLIRWRLAVSYFTCHTKQNLYFLFFLHLDTIVLWSIGGFCHFRFSSSLQCCLNKLVNSAIKCDQRQHTFNILHVNTSMSTSPSLYCYFCCCCSCMTLFFFSHDTLLGHAMQNVDNIWHRNFFFVSWSEGPRYFQFKCFIWFQAIFQCALHLFLLVDAEFFPSCFDHIWWQWTISVCTYVADGASLSSETDMPRQTYRIVTCSPELRGC